MTEEAATTLPKRDITLGVLTEEFPLAFGAPVRPLKVGLHVDLHGALQGAASMAHIRDLVGAYTRKVPYLQALSQGGARVDLQGQPAGDVTEEAQRDARRNLLALETRSPEAKAGRATLLKAFEASGLSFGEFAQQRGLALAEAQSQLDQAINERNVRRAKRAAEAKAFHDSGLAIEAFAAKHGKDPVALQRTVDRVAAPATTPPRAESLSTQRRRAERAIKFGASNAPRKVPDSANKSATNSKSSDHQVPDQVNSANPSA